MLRPVFYFLLGYTVTSLAIGAPVKSILACTAATLLGAALGSLIGGSLWKS